MKTLILALLLTTTLANAEDAGNLYCGFGNLGAANREGSCQLYGNMSGIAYKINKNKQKTWSYVGANGAMALSSVNPPNLQARKPILQTFAVSNAVNGSVLIEGCDPMVNAAIGSCRLGALRIPTPGALSVLAVKAKISYVASSTVQIIADAADSKAVGSAICSHLGYSQRGSVTVAEPIISPGFAQYPQPHSIVRVELYSAVNRDAAFHLVRVNGSAGQIEVAEDKEISERGFIPGSQDVIFIPQRGPFTPQTILMPIKRVQCE